MTYTYQDFHTSCINGDLEKARHIYNIGMSQTIEMSDYAFTFRSACKNGRLQVAKWLYSPTQGQTSLSIETNTSGRSQWVITKHKRNMLINIHEIEDLAFRNACGHGHLLVAKWLYSLGGVNINVLQDHAFIWACKNGHLRVAKWLYSLGGLSNYTKNGIKFYHIYNDGTMFYELYEKRYTNKKRYTNVAKFLIKIGIVPPKKYINYVYLNVCINDIKYFYNFYLQHRENTDKLNKYLIRETYKHKFATKSVSMIISKYL